MRISPETVEELDAYVDENLDEITALVNDARDRLGDAFGEDVDEVTKDDVRDEFDAFLEDGDAALNVAALYRVGVELEVRNDSDFIRVYLMKLIPSEDVDLRQDREEKLDYLNRLWEFLQDSQ